MIDCQMYVRWTFWLKLSQESRPLVMDILLQDTLYTRNAKQNLGKIINLPVDHQLGNCSIEQLH